MSGTPVRNIRDFLKLDRNTIRMGLHSVVDVVYEDGVTLRLTPNEIIVNRYILDLVEIVPKIKINSPSSITMQYVNGYYNSKSINKCFEELKKSVLDVYVRPYNNREVLASVHKAIFQIFNNINNEIIYNNTKYVSSLNILDMLDIQSLPPLLEAIDNTAKELTAEAVENAYTVLDDLIRNEPYIKDNPLRIGYVSGNYNPNQIKQLLGGRGFVSETDGSIFKYPIPTSFVLGMRNMYNLAIESRSGARALTLSTTAIQHTEYFAREMQLVTMALEKLIDGDCGNHNYFDWKLRKTDTINDLQLMAGKRYLADDGVERILQASDTHLMGTTIKVRMVNGCNSLKDGAICTACFGDLSNSVPIHSNIGHYCLVVVTAIISQLVLSTKHTIASAIAVALNLTGDAPRFFTVKNKDSYAFKSTVLNKVRTKLYMKLPYAAVAPLKDIDVNTNVRKLNPTRISSVSDFTMIIEQADGTLQPFPILLGGGNTTGSFTYEFLEFIKTANITTTETDLTIDLNGWNTTAPVIKVPQKEFSYLELARSIKKEFKFMTHEGENAETTEAMVQKLYELVNSKLKINIALIEVIVQGFVCTDIDAGDFTLGDNGDKARPASISAVITGRSLGSAYAWEQVIKTIFSPHSFDNENVTGHPLDQLLVPEATSTHHAKQ